MCGGGCPLLLRMVPLRLPLLMLVAAIVVRACVRACVRADPGPCLWRLPPWRRGTVAAVRVFHLRPRRGYRPHQGTLCVDWTAVLSLSVLCCPTVCFEECCESRALAGMLGVFVGSGS
jgi:hypothetical protein